MKINIIIFLLLLTNTTLFSQLPPIKFDEITHEDGINSFLQYGGIDVFQDHKGFIWMGGCNGLQRYDGYEFVDYSNQVNFRSEVNFMQDSRDLLWISSKDGIHLFNPEDEKTAFYSPDTGFSAVDKVIEGKDGTIWCASIGLCLVRMEPKIKDPLQLKQLIFEKGPDAAFNISFYRISTNEIYRPSNFAIDVFEDSMGGIWLTTLDGVYVFNEKTLKFIRIDDETKEKSSYYSTYFFAIVPESKDVIWVNSNKGFTRISKIHDAYSGANLNKAGLKFEYYPYGSNDLLNEYKGFIIDHKKNFWYTIQDKGLLRMNVSDNNQATYETAYVDLFKKGKAEYTSVGSILEDRTGLIWLGHWYPVVRKFRPEQSAFTPMEGYLDHYPHVNYDFNEIYEDADHNFWVCVWGSGVFKISQSGRVTKYELKSPLYPDQNGRLACSILEIEKGVFWVGTYNGIWQLDSRTGRCQKPLIKFGDFFASRLIRKDNLILMEQMDTHFLFYYNLKTKNLELPYVQYGNIIGLKTKKIKMQGLTKSGTLWIVNDSIQIARSLYDIKTGALRITLLSDSITRNFYKYIAEIKDGYIIDEDREGNLWIYDRTKGILLELDFKTGNIQKWDLKEGFYGSSGIEIKSLLEDKNGSIWLASNYTLFMLDKEKGILKSFDKGDGLPEISHSRFCALVDSKGFLYFGGMNGFYRVEPDRLYKNTAIPPIVITEFRIFNKRIGIDTSRKSILTRNIAFTREINLKYNQNDLSFTFAALDYNNPAKNRYAYRMEGYQKDWIETGAEDRTAAYTNLKHGKYVFRVKGTNNDGVWNEEGTFVNIIIHPPFWRTLLAYFAYGILFLMLLRGYIYWRTRRIRKEKMVLERQVAERTTKIEEQKEELVVANTLLEEQQEELMKQKEELQTTLENLQKAQEQLIESEKMAAIGGLVAGVAHEMNTPLGIGITAVSNLMEDVEKMAALYEKDEISRKDFKGFLESTHDTAKLIQKNLERAASLIQSFKQVSSDQVTEQQRVFALKEYINDILLSLRPKFREKKIEFNIVCDDELQMNSYPGVFAQIFTNLLLNSLQHGFYKRDTGLITIKADISNDHLKIQYSDNGTGISKKDLPHIFEPFYTSDQHRGTGLGLNIIYSLIKQKLRGTITCTSNMGEGVLFEIEVPQ